MKFIQPVSMPCTKEQYEEFLKEPLLRMGYKEDSTTYWKSVDCQFVATNYDDVPSSCGNIMKASRRARRRFYIETFNPELFLAIAAMTDEKYGIPGEYWSCLKGDVEQKFLTGNVYKSKTKADEAFFLIDELGNGNGFVGCNLERFRKSTLSELVEQLEKQETNKPEMKTHKTTRQDLAKIWEVACSTWKPKIEEYASKYGNPLSDELNIPEDIVLEMFRSATPEQERIINTVFPDSREDTNAWKQLSSSKLMEAKKACRTLGETTGLSGELQILGNAVAEAIDRPELDGRALWVYHTVDVVLHLQGENTIIEFRRR